ncbi:MAG: starch-binding protein, partial [Eubacteriales bacterium]|nr:starch-binding protein [Eubacteriales bacterium]
MKKSTRVLSVVLAMLMLFSVFSVGFSAKEVEVAETGVTMTGGEVLYLKPNSNWTQANARFAAYFFGSGNKWASMDACPRDTGYYKVTVPSGSWTNVIFCRMNPSSTSNNWNNKWNQTGDLTYDGTKNLFTVSSGSWDGATSSWSVWSETPAPTEAPVDPTPSEDVSETPSETPSEEPTEEPTEEETETPEPPISMDVYCINSAKWDAVCAYAWVEGGDMYAEWPGVAMTKTEETVNGFDVYKITIEGGPYTSIIFNNNNKGSQTDDLTLEEGQYYDVKAGEWYASLDEVPVLDPLSTDRYLVGEFNGWSTVADEFKLKAEGEKTGYVTLTLDANTKYQFKVVREGTWTICATPITGSVEGITFSSSTEGNATITTTEAGEYTFSFGLDNSQLGVVYPEVEEPTDEPSETPSEEPS